MAYLHRVFSFLCLIKDGFHRFYIGKSLFSQGKKVCEKHMAGGEVIIIGRITCLDVLGLWYLIFQQCSCGTP